MQREDLNACIICGCKPSVERTSFRTKGSFKIKKVAIYVCGCSQISISKSRDEKWQDDDWNAYAIIRPKPKNWGNEVKPEPREFYLLKSDGDGTMHSVCVPFGYAVETEEEAKAFVRDANFGYSHDYMKITVLDTWKECVKDWEEEH